jgi:hypothetical protein
LLFQREERTVIQAEAATRGEKSAKHLKSGANSFGKTAGFPFHHDQAVAL